MPNLKRKLKKNDDVVQLSTDLVDQLKPKSIYTNDDSLISIKKQKLPENKITKEETKVLSSKERKKLEKIVQKKKNKKLISEKINSKNVSTIIDEEKLKVIAKSKNINDTILFLSSQQKVTASNLKKMSAKEVQRKTLSEKVKTLSKKKLMKLKKPYVETENSTDTSDISTDESDNEVEITSNTENIEIIEKDIVDKQDEIIEQNKVEEAKVEIESVKTEKAKPAIFKLVDRIPEIIESRNNLPILEVEMEIMDAISDNDVVVITGATGSGKTTQVPQFLYEAGYTNDGKIIGVTEPRRVAAVSVSKRVSLELNIPDGCSEVGYQIRFDKSSTVNTKIKFMTDGVLLQEMKQDFLLSKYSAIIIDEAHERSVHTDLLIGFLVIVSKLRRKRYEAQQLELTKDGEIQSKNIISPLKLIIMSATLCVEDFLKNDQLFITPPPLVKVSGRQFKVTVQFAKHTRPDYLIEAYKKAVEIHKTEPTGGILIFVTSQKDVEMLCKWLRLAFPLTDAFLEEQKNTKPTLSLNQQRKLNNKVVAEEISFKNFSIIPEDEEMELYTTDNKHYDDDNIEDSEVEGDDDDVDNGFIDEAITNFDRIMNGKYMNKHCKEPMHVLPLFSMLASNKQKEIWKPVPEGQRLVIVSTNVAETSVTIPDIKYVIDCGLQKEKIWDPKTGLSRFTLSRISKASAQQRTGRAGRVNNGKCFRLYSSAVYERMNEHPIPEILRRPVDDLLLYVKGLYYEHGVLYKKNLPALPSMPSDEAIEEAEKHLISLGAFRKWSDKEFVELTPLGKKISKISLPPRFAKMLLLGSKSSVAKYAILMVSVLTIPNIMHTSNENENESKIPSELENFRKELMKKRYNLLLGDIATLVMSIIQLDCVRRQHGKEKARQYALQHGIRYKAYEDIMEQMKNLIQILNNSGTVEPLDFSEGCFDISNPDEDRVEYLRKLVLVSSSNNVAVQGYEIKCDDKKLERLVGKRGYTAANGTTEPVFIHSQSIYYQYKPEWVVYQDISRSETAQSSAESKNIMRIITEINPEWLPSICAIQCQFSQFKLNKDTIFYNQKEDRLEGLPKNLYYGENRIPLPMNLRITLNSSVINRQENSSVYLDKCRQWLARFFMEGKLFEPMMEWIEHFMPGLQADMLVINSFFDKSAVSGILEDFSQLKEFTASEIKKIWKKDRQFLLNSYLRWIKPQKQKLIIKNWPPIQS